jgi:dihydroorotate dehydrogenase electron transfer subunit
MHQTVAQLVETAQLAEDIWLHRYRAPDIAREARPGQFINVKVAGGDFPLLRRPFSIAFSDAEETIEILFKVRGAGTRILAQRQENSEVDVLGPLGKPFEIESSRKPMLVGGGVGIAPLLFLAATLSAHGKKPMVLFGAKTREQLILREKVAGLASDLVLITEDGSEGEEGLATHYVERYAALVDSIYACGPEAMLQTIAEQAAGSSLFCQVSLERAMACGVGACLGCVAATKHGYKLTCKDGPVFDAHEIEWNNSNVARGDCRVPQNK